MMTRAQLGSALALICSVSACYGDDGVDPSPASPDDGGTPATVAAGSGGAAAGGSSGTGGEIVDGPELGNEASVLTWNLESYPLTANAEAKAVQLLGELAPDLVALQEISDPEAFVGLVEALDDYDGVLNDDPGGYIRVGLLWRKDRVTISNVETLFQSDWYAFPRPPLRAHVTIDAPTPIDFVTVVLHLKAMLNGESEERRRTACERLDTWLSYELEQGQEQEQDYMLIGDLNDKVTDPPQWNVFGVFLDQPETYSFLTMSAAEAGGHTYIPYQSFIDHVLVTTAMLDEVGTGVTEVLALDDSVANYRDLTDHRPVRTWLRWGTP